MQFSVLYHFKQQVTIGSTIPKLLHALFPSYAKMAKLNGPRKCVSFVLMLTACMATIVESGNNCLQCEHLNRMDSAKDCPTNVKDCGECFKGMIKVSWDDSCIPFDLEIIENPKNTTSTIGKSVILKCRNSHEADCEWFRQGSIINVHQDKEHYRYISYKNGNPTKNCDLEIISYREEDSGKWECRIFTDYDRVRSKEAWLYSSGEVMILSHPIHAIVQVKKEFVLNCKFNLPVQCEWLHKGKLVRMKKGVYQFVEKSDNNKRDDCSVKISSFKRKDAGEWQCRNIPIGKDPIVSSQKATLYDSKSQVGKCSKSGDKVILHCYLSQSGECTWQRNKSVVKIASRYKYVAKNINPKATTDCSIIIQKFLEIDAAEWQCGSNSNDNSDGKFESNAKPCILKGPQSPPKPRKIKRSISRITNTTLPEAFPQVEQHPSSGNYNLGDNITLQCVFNKPISECFWLRNDHNVVIEHRYRFIGSEIGANTTDCSIIIQQFQQTDLGSWICGSVADDQHNGVLSETSYLDVINYDYDSYVLDDDHYEFDDNSYELDDDHYEFDDNSYELDADDYDSEIDMISVETVDKTQMEDARPQSNVSKAVVYLSVAVSALAIIIVILLSFIAIFWFTRVHREHVTNKTKNKYTTINNIESIMEDEMYKSGSQTRLIQE